MKYLHLGLELGFKGVRNRKWEGNSSAGLWEENWYILERNTWQRGQMASRTPGRSTTSHWILPTAWVCLEEKPKHKKHHMKTAVTTDILISASNSWAKNSAIWIPDFCPVMLWYKKWVKGAGTEHLRSPQFVHSQHHRGMKRNGYYSVLLDLYSYYIVMEN